jgi:sugar (pentulose or hexulose) kinase
MQFPETVDEDGDACEDVNLLQSWVLESWNEVLSLDNFVVNALNFSTYGASFVYVNEEGNILTPL